MAALDFPGTEGRRSVKTKLVMPLRVHGQTRTGEEFSVEAETHTVSGCYLRRIFGATNTLVPRWAIRLNPRQDAVPSRGRACGPA